VNARAVALTPRTDTAAADELDAAERFIAIGDSETARTIRRATVTAYTSAFTDLAGWANATPAQRLSVPLPVRGLVAYLLLATGYPAGVDYVRSCRSEWGHHAKLVYPDFADTFGRAARAVGFTALEARRQWGTLAKIAATAGVSPETLDAHRFRDVADELTAAHTTRHGRIPLSWSTPLHGLNEPSR